MATVTPINKNDVNEELVSELEGLLEAAKSGELVALAGADSYRNKPTSMFWCGMGTQEMVHTLDELKFDMQLASRMQELPDDMD